MRASLITALVAVLPVLAYPGMGKTMDEIRKRAGGDGDDDDDGGEGAEDFPVSDKFDSLELIGDLVDLPANKLSNVGFSIKELLTNSNSFGESNEAYRPKMLAAKGSAACAKDTCCIWKYIADEAMVPKFRGKSGRCTDLARGAIRLGFHDAGAWSKYTKHEGGADGSIILAEEEMQRSENRGLEEIVAQVKVWYDQYKKYGIGMADLIQFAANTATVVCPLGPRTRTFIGRKDSSEPAAEGLLPPVTGSADFLIDLFVNKTIKPHGLTALIGAHSTSQQRFVDPERAGDPQDSTPGVWDIAFYQETLGTAPARVFKFASDLVLSVHPSINQEFRAFADPTEGQKHWDADYAREYVRLSLLGVYNINDLVECSKSLPSRTATFKQPDQSVIDKWLAAKDKALAASRKVMDGDVLTEGGLLGIVKSIWPF